MKKFFLSVIFLSLVASCHAAPCYGTRIPEKKQVFVGLQNNNLFKRYLKNEEGKIRSNQSFVLLSYGLFDWLSLDLKGGAGNLKHRSGTSSEVDYSYNFAGGYGFRLRLYERDDIKFVFGFQHISVHPRTKHIDGVKHKGVLDDWQVSLLGSKEMGRFTPYLGTKWSRTDYIHWIEQDRKRIMSDLTKSIGLIVGTDFSIKDDIWLNLEGRFFDEEGCSFSINYSF